MFRYVPFDEIEKNKWNGTVHYAPNGNIFGYYWFLKATYKQWDAIVEEDYQSVIPILPKSKLDIYQLTPQLGPYSVNPLNEFRTSAMMDLMKTHCENAYYPINNRSSSQNHQSTNDIILSHQELNLIDSYDSLQSGYTEVGKQLMTSAQEQDITFTSSIKPEVIVAELGINKDVQNAYLRIMYNAMHRGIGWSQGIISKKTKKYLALSFFVVSHNVIHEIISLPKGDIKYKYLLYDMSIRNSAGKPSLLTTYQAENINKELGFSINEHRLIKLKSNGISKIRQALNMPI